MDKTCAVITEFVLPFLLFQMKKNFGVPTSLFLLILFLFKVESIG